MDGKALVAAAVLASTCQGGTDSGNTFSPVDLSTCEVAPDYGTAYVESAEPDGDELLLYVDYEGCEDARFTVCWSGELFHNPEGPTAVLHLGMDQADVDDCPYSSVRKAVWVDVSAMQTQAAVEFPNAEVARVWIDGYVAEWPLY